MPPFSQTAVQEARPGLRRVLGPVRGLALSLGVVVGAGIFVLPGYVAELLGEPRGFLLVWLAAGFFALCVALSYAELATRRPYTGGYVVYLREMYGDRMAFVYGWAALLVLYPSGIATVAWAFAQSAQHLLNLHGQGTLLALALVAAAVGLNVCGVELSSRAQVVLSAAKISALLLLAIGGLLPASAPESGSVGPAPTAALTGLSAWFLAFVIASWCFDGFLEIVVVAGEVERPARNLWRVLVGSVVVVTGAYSLYALALVRRLGMDGIADSRSAAADLASHIAGMSGSVLVDGLILLATASGVVSVLFSGPRIIVALAQRRLFFPAAARISARTGAPTPAVLIMGGAAFAYAAIGRLDELVKYFSVYTGLFSVLILLGGVRLRLSGEVSPAERRIPFWPLPPLLAMVATLLGIFYVVRDQPRASLAGLLLLLIARPFAGRFSRREDRLPR